MRTWRLTDLGRQDYYRIRDNPQDDMTARVQGAMAVYRGARPITITTFGFQAGPDGYVRYGTAEGTITPDMQPGPGGWGDYVYKLAAGGRGGGKSKGGALAVTNYGLHWPGAWGLVTAPTYYTMYGATLPALFWAFNQFGLSESDYHYIHTREEIDFVNGFKILLRTTEKPERLRGPDIGVVWMDEARDSHKDAFDTLIPTMRQAGYPHHFHITTTPAGRLHWIYPLFFKSEAAFAHRKHWFAPTIDNPFGGRENYLQSLEIYGENTPRERQELFGEFIVMEGLVYDSFDPTTQIEDEELWPDRPLYYVAGMDFGYNDPSALLVVGVDGFGRQYIVDEWFQRGADYDEMMVEVYRMHKQYNFKAIACDAARPEWIRALRTNGMPAIRAYKRVTETMSNPNHGVHLCQRALKFKVKQFAEKGEHRKALGWRMHPRCIHFREEIESYIWDEPKGNDLNLREKPKDAFNHLMDAWRYSEEYLAMRMGLGATPALKMNDRDVEPTSRLARLPGRALRRAGFNATGRSPLR